MSTICMHTDRRIVSDPPSVPCDVERAGSWRLREADSRIQGLPLQARPGSAPGDHTLFAVRWGPPQGLQVAIDRLRVLVDTPVVHVAVIVPRRPASAEADGHQRRVIEAERQGAALARVRPVCPFFLRQGLTV